MKLTVTRFDEGKYETVVTRDDGVSYRLKGVAHMFAIPHDLAHFLVEKTLRLDRGFWGSVADGAVFKTMSYIGGRRKPKAAERSESLLKANAAALNEAEAVVRIFNDTIEQGHPENSPVLRERLRNRLARPGLKFRRFSDTEISEVYGAYRDMLAKWQQLPVGGSIELKW
ncbi:MAG: hypothetical protein QOD11_1188 [Bradyrhizobium sp.]|jgi:hypothetical protein|nr:hypothetical protein [Bradyrhizobium sp.]